MPMIDFDRLAKGNGVGWSQESIVVALCAEIGQLRMRIRALEAVSHAPVTIPDSRIPNAPQGEEPSARCGHEFDRGRCIHCNASRPMCERCKVEAARTPRWMAPPECKHPVPSPAPTREEPKK